MENLVKEINEMKTKINKLKRELEKEEEKLSLMCAKKEAKFGHNYKGVNIKTRKGSYIITREDGLSVTMNKKRNAHNERNIYWYNKKKGNIAIESTRMNQHNVAMWLKEF